ncbi:MAG: hypothetical protein LBF78_12835 [Treponema sp.]|jgi:hypothetical protein|nr:hypothetical protein [Treponema sp.]
MAIFKPLRQKDRSYVFTVFDNEKSGSPARAVFSRFPLPDELFPAGPQKNILESSLVKDFDNTPEAKEKLVKNILDTMVENITANRFDHAGFVRECVDHFENFFYGEKEIKTVDDFLALPPEAVHKIAGDLYFYSRVEDEFTMGE